MSPRTHRARPRAEALEGRSLLSHATPRLLSQATPHVLYSSSPPPDQSVDIPAHTPRLVQLPSPTPSQSVDIQAQETVFASDTTRIKVTLTRSVSGPALLRKPLSYSFVGFYDNADPPPLPPGISKAAPPIRPDFKKSVTFRPGETIKTISLPIPAVSAGSPDYVIRMGRPMFLGWSYAMVPEKMVKVYASPDRIPPTIVGKRLTPQGLALTFDKPMNPATVQDVKNYQVEIFTGVSPNQNVTLSAAVYDPATQTVTLIPALTPGNNSYFVFIKRRATNTSITALTDLEGNPYLTYGHVEVDPS